MTARREAAWEAWLNDRAVYPLSLNEAKDAFEYAWKEAYNQACHDMRRRLVFHSEMPEEPTT